MFTEHLSKIIIIKDVINIDAEEQLSNMSNRVESCRPISLLSIIAQASGLKNKNRF